MKKQGNNQTVLFICIGAGALLLLVIVLVVANSGGGAGVPPEVSLRNFADALKREDAAAIVSMIHGSPDAKQNALRSLNKFFASVKVQSVNLEVNGSRQHGDTADVDCSFSLTVKDVKSGEVRPIQWSETQTWKWNGSGWLLPVSSVARFQAAGP